MFVQHGFLKSGLLGLEGVEADHAFQLSSLPSVALAIICKFCCSDGSPTGRVSLHTDVPASDPRIAMPSRIVAARPRSDTPAPVDSA